MNNRLYSKYTAILNMASQPYLPGVLAFSFCTKRKVLAKRLHRFPSLAVLHERHPSRSKNPHASECSIVLPHPCGACFFA
jgi:hypothetical protein